MRIAFISDLHACLKALDDVLADAKSRHVDEIYCLGDIVDLGPEPNEIVERLRELDIPCVRGNHDTLDEHPELEFLLDVERFTIETLDQEKLDWLAALPFQKTIEVDGLRLLLVHGSPNANTEGLVAETPAQEIDQWLESERADVILAGHTHVPLVRRVTKGLAVNVGSTSMPFVEANAIPPVGLPFSDYTIVDIANGKVSVEQVRIPLDLDALKTAVANSDMPHGETLIGSYLVGQDQVP